MREPRVRLDRPIERIARDAKDVDRVGLVVLDVAVWAASLLIVVATRYDWELADIRWSSLAIVMALAGMLHLGLGGALGLYRRRYPLGSADEAATLAIVLAGTGGVLFVVNVVAVQPLVPRSVPPVAAVVALTLAAGSRLFLRTHRERASRARPESRRVIVLGADACGHALVRSMLSGAEHEYVPVAVLDDDPTRRGSRVCGVPVRGSHLALAEVAREQHADLLLIAVRNLEPSILREVSRLADAVRLTVKIVPALSERLTSGLGVVDLDDLDVNELLGRIPHDTDVSAATSYLAGKRVLVTGAGGSIGSELCRQLRKYAPDELLMLDRDESALHAVQLSLYGTALLDSPDVILADLRDAAAIDAVFREHRPHVVFHAAALKHLPMLEQYPNEAWKTNVLGTAQVLESARRHGVDRLVNISTDKAANPSSVLGRSKRIGERLVAGASPTEGGTFLSVRFGNVLGSRGSVLTTFCEQLAAGTPLTVTHPEVTRFFMTIPEAVALVIQAGAIGRPGEALVLDMGKPVSIREVAEQLMELTGTTVPVVYTGLREGEKLHEELFGVGERDDRPRHPAISHVTVPPLPLARVQEPDPAQAAELMAVLVADPLDEEALAPPQPRRASSSLVLQGPWRSATPATRSSQP